MRKVIQVNSTAQSASNVPSPLLEYVRFTEVKRLVHQIHQEQKKRGAKSLAVLSLHPGEGRTFFVSALALGYALLLRKKVLIVDATSQTLNGYLFMDRVMGRTEEELAELGGPLLEVVDLMSAHNKEGKGGESAEFLIGPVIEAQKDQYDLVLFDTSALERRNKNNMDPVIIASQADASIILHSPSSADREAMFEMRRAVNGWNIDVLGTVFNAGAPK
ncbi:MAG: hypothetical protein IT285_01355 [Bdellovibrionales bacterium]|nr:hypothetical protein [Bdellovibrionales bacterium]